MGLDTVLTVLLVTASLWFMTWDDHFISTTLRDKNILITCNVESCAGLGQQLAYQYSRLMSRVMLVSTRPTDQPGDQFRGVADRCRQLGAQEVHTMVTDLSKEDDRRNVVAKVGSVLGGLDHLVMLDYEWPPSNSNPAASSSRSNVTLKEDSRSSVVPLADLADRFLPMLSERGGRMGLVTSVAGRIGSLRPDYSANLFALHGYFSSLRHQLVSDGLGVTVSLGLLLPPARSAIAGDDSAGEALESAATSILQGVTVGSREIYAGRMSYLVVNAHAVIPSYVERYLMTY